MIRPIAEFSGHLKEAAQLIGATPTNLEVIFTGITHADSDVEPGDIFLAIPGARFHGAEFVKSAKAKGAVAVITDVTGANLDSSLPTLVVKDVRVAGALLASSLYKSPLRDLVSIGITGTNGKTTVSTLLYQIFQAVGRETGLIGTVETRIGVERLSSVRTTPEAPELQALAAVMRERHVRNLVMEVSSHALSMGRMKGSHFAIAAFTNLSQDHLDFHKDMDSYFQAKASLFTDEYADVALINIDTPYGARLAANTKLTLKKVSRSNSQADWHFTSLNPTGNGVDFSIRGSGGILIESRTRLHGNFNADNLLLALALAHECGVDPLELAAVAPHLTGASGRLDEVVLGQPFKAFVDYAHTPDAVTNVLAAVREFTPGRIIAILGCGGDRDTTKRPLMGKALLNGSDVAIFTSDNPRSESPSSILKEMTSGIEVKSPSVLIEDRKAAIVHAVALAKAGDTILILGKGHEQGQEIAGAVQPFDDRLVLATAIEEQG
jgi:UDP-N-acetylmuramoyl-L-alanyl-D-glutamate--2,6-diaminopimelate ligase